MTKRRPGNDSFSDWRSCDDSLPDRRPSDDGLSHRRGYLVVGSYLSEGTLGDSRSHKGRLLVGDGDSSSGTRCDDRSSYWQIKSICLLVHVSDRGLWNRDASSGGSAGSVGYRQINIGEMVVNWSDS